MKVYVLWDYLNSDQISGIYNTLELANKAAIKFSKENNWDLEYVLIEEFEVISKTKKKI